MSKRRTILLMIAAISLIGIVLMVAQAAFATSDDIPDRNVTIVSWYPDGDITDTKGAARVFNITINQTVDVRWLMNGAEVYNESGVNVSSYRNMSAAAGYRNVTVYVSNGNGSDTHTWLWTVSDTHSPILINGYVQYTEGDPSNVSVTVTNLNTGYNVAARTATNQSYYQIRTSSAHICSGDILRFNASEGGRYSLRDYNVTDEDVKTGGFIQNFAGSKPDLVVTNKSESLPGCGAFTVSYRIENMGDGIANESNTSIYVDGVLVAKDPVGVLAMSEYYENTVGSFHRAYDRRNTTVTVCADCDDAVNESAMEDNNCMENELVYDGPLPNLYFHKHSVSTPDSKGQFTIYYFVTNMGGSGCHTCPTNTTISITNVSVNGSATDITVKSPVKRINSSSYREITLPPFTCSPGKEVRVNISLDGDHEVLEGDETDNNWTTTFLCPAAKPDLEITEYKKQGISEADKTFNLTYTVENIGRGNANNSTTWINNTGLACTQEIFDSVPALAPGENYTSTVGPLRLCGDLHVYYVFSTNITITADYDGVVDEADEGNNHRVYRPGLPFIQILEGDIEWIDGENKTFRISGINIANPPSRSGAALNWSKLRIYLDGNLSFEKDVPPIGIGKFYEGGAGPLMMPEGKDTVTIRSCIEWVSEWDGSNSSSCKTTTFGGGACIGDDGYIVTCGTSITGHFGEIPTISKSCTLTGDMYCPGGIHIAGSDIVIDGNGSEIFGWGDRYSWGSNSHTISVYINAGCDNVTIKNLEVKNHITGICMDDIYDWGDANNITIENCSVYDNIRYGLYIDDSWLTFLHNNTVCNNSITDIIDKWSMSATFGDENTCGTAENYDDEATTGCTYHCDGVNGVCVGATRNFTCGDVVTESCTFDRAISCPSGDGLIAGADGIVIDGARYKLIGNCVGAGIISNHAGVVVRNLQVTDFSTGIMVEGTNNTIESCTLRKNAKTGINLNADNCTVRDTRIYDNLGSGIVVFGNNSTFTNNTAARNPGYGFYFSPHTVNNMIIANFIGDNEGVDINATTTNLTGDENTCDTTDSYWDDSMLEEKMYGCVYPWTPPDLTITTLKPREVRTDEGVRYDTRYTIENIGDPDSRRVKSMSWLYVNHNDFRDATDQVELLGPGGMNTRNFDYPVTITGGNDTDIKVCADGPDEIREINEADKFYCNMVGCYTVPDFFKFDEEMNNCMTATFSNDSVGEGLEGGVCVCEDGECKGVDRGYYICGDEVKESCTFNGSMECQSGHGFEIHGSDITIDGADHELKGPGNATCEDYDEGAPGDVDCGVYIAEGSGNTVKSLQITGFCTGIGVLGADENTIDNCYIYGNGMGRGIHLAEVTGSTIRNTKVHENSNGGIYIGQSSNDNTIESNDVCENGGDGIHTAGTTTIKGNTVCQNGGTDIVAENEHAHGDENTCYATEDYNDDGTVGCTYPCDNPDLTVTENCGGWVGDPENREYAITYTIANVGCKDALDECNVRVCVDGACNDYPVPALGRGGSHTDTIEGFTLSGVEDVINVTVDPDNEIAEMDEHNNSLKNTWYAMPDLTITTFDVPRDLTLFGDSTAGATIANIGTIAADAFDVTLYVNDKAEETFRVEGLDAGDTVSHSFDWFVLASNRLVVVADSKGEIDERDELNNKSKEELRSISDGPPGEPGDKTPHIYDPDGLPEDPDSGIDLAEMARIESMDYDVDDMSNGSASGRVSKERVSAQLFKSVPFLSDASDIVVSHTGLTVMGALFIMSLFLIGYRGEILVHRRNGR